MALSGEVALVGSVWDPNNGTRTGAAYTFATGTSTNREESEVPTVRHRLHAVYPNPSAGSVSVEYDLAWSSAVTLEIFDLLGRRTELLVARQQQPPGRHRYSWDMKETASGTYLIRLRMGQTESWSKFVVR